MKDHEFAVHMMETYKHVNENEDGISFAKEGFTQLYDAVLPILKKNVEEENRGDRYFKGGLFAGVFVGGLAVAGFMMLKKALTEPVVSTSYEEEARAEMEAKYREIRLKADNVIEMHRKRKSNSEE